MSCVTLVTWTFENPEVACAHLIRGISPISEAYYSIYKKYIGGTNYGNNLSS